MTQGQLKRAHRRAALAGTGKHVRLHHDHGEVHALLTDHRRVDLRAHREPFFLGARWLSALAAAVFDVLLVRPSRSTLDAAFAALALVFR